jgi:hypothetical protein
MKPPSETGPDSLLGTSPTIKSYVMGERQNPERLHREKQPPGGKLRISPGFHFPNRNPEVD